MPSYQLTALPELHTPTSNLWLHHFLHWLTPRPRLTAYANSSKTICAARANLQDSNWAEVGKELDAIEAGSRQ